MADGLSYARPPIRVRFHHRFHRFAARVLLPDGSAWTVHVPNPGRMRELLRSGARGWVVPDPRPGRTTPGTLVSVEHRGTLVSIDTQLPNRIIRRLLEGPEGPKRLGLPAGRWRPEFPYGDSRFDFGLPGPGGVRPLALLEVKSANLRVGDRAEFPDAPTERGSRHLRELTRAARAGIRALVLFCVQRSDVRAVAPNRAMDPEFARAFDDARAAGVGFDAYRLRVRPERVALDRRLPVQP